MSREVNPEVVNELRLPHLRDFRNGYFEKQIVVISYAINVSRLILSKIFHQRKNWLRAGLFSKTTDVRISHA